MNKKLIEIKNENRNIKSENEKMKAINEKEHKNVNYKLEQMRKEYEHKLSNLNVTQKAQESKLSVLDITNESYKKVMSTQREELEKLREMNKVYNDITLLKDELSKLQKVKKFKTKNIDELNIIEFNEYSEEQLNLTEI